MLEKLADKIWMIVQNWDYFSKDTVGKQLVRSINSVCANIAEGSGRYNHQDNKRFVHIARGSLNETRHWLRRAYARKLLNQEQISKIQPIIDELSPMLNAYLNSIKPCN